MLDIKEIKYQYCQELDFEYEQFLNKLDLHPNTLDVKKFKWRLLEMFNESINESITISDIIETLRYDNRELLEKVEHLEYREDELENEVEAQEKTIQELEDKLKNYEQD